MTDQSELDSRAALCRKLAQREPANHVFWTAEAENWSRLSKEKRGVKYGVKIDSGILVRLQIQSAKFLLMLALQTLRKIGAVKDARRTIPISRTPAERGQPCGERSAI